MNSTKDLTSVLISPASNNQVKPERTTSQAPTNNDQAFSSALARQKEKRMNEPQQAKPAKSESNTIKKEEKTKNTDKTQDADQEKISDNTTNATLTANQAINSLSHIAPITSDQIQAFINNDTQATQTVVVDTKIDPNAKIASAEASGNISLIDTSNLTTTLTPQTIAQSTPATNTISDTTFKNNTLQKDKNFALNINPQQNANPLNTETSLPTESQSTQTVGFEKMLENIKPTTSQQISFDQAEKNQQQIEANNNFVPLADKNLMQSLHLSNNHQHTYQAQIQAPLGSQHFVEETAQQLQFAIGKQAQFAELKITPADMGPISIKIDMQGNQANLQFIVTQADTKQAIEDALPKLRELFAQAGLQLNGSDVNQQSQQFQQQQQNAHPKWQNNMQLNELTTTDTGITTQRYTVKGMLDIFA